MATNENGNLVFCIISHSGDFPDGEYFLNGIESPKKIEYWGIYPKDYNNPLYSKGSESRKNINVKNGSDTYVFERVSKSDQYFFHGKYKYLSHELKTNPFDKSNRPNSILFHLEFNSKEIC